VTLRLEEWLSTTEPGLSAGSATFQKRRQTPIALRAIAPWLRGLGRHPGGDANWPGKAVGAMLRCGKVNADGWWETGPREGRSG